MTVPNIKPTSDGPNGWAEYRRLVLSELERLSITIAKIELHNTSSQLTTSQSLSDMKLSILDKVRQTVDNLETEFNKSSREQTVEHKRQVDVLKEQTEKDVETLTKKTDKHGEKIDLLAADVIALKTKAFMLGALSGFIISVIGLLASLFLKK